MNRFSMVAGRIHRVIIAWAIATSVVFSLLVFYWQASWLPPPEKASRTQLLHWLASRSLASQPVSVQRSLLGRLEEEFISGFVSAAHRRPLDETFVQLDTKSQSQWRSNFQLLAKVWIESQVDVLHSRDDPSGKALILSIDRALQWRTASEDFLSQDEIAGIWAEMAFENEPSKSGSELFQVRCVLDALRVWLMEREIKTLPVARRRDLARTIWFGLESRDTLDHQTSRCKAMPTALNRDSNLQLQANAHGLLICACLSQVEQWAADHPKKLEAERLRAMSRIVAWQAFFDGDHPEAMVPRPVPAEAAVLMIQRFEELQGTGSEFEADAIARLVEDLRDLDRQWITSQSISDRD